MSRVHAWFAPQVEDDFRKMKCGLFETLSSSTEGVHGQVDFFALSGEPMLLTLRVGERFMKARDQKGRPENHWLDRGNLLHHGASVFSGRPF